MAYRSHYALPRKHRPIHPPAAALSVIGEVVRAQQQALLPYLHDHILQVASIDTTNHWVYLKRSGDAAANNGYPYRYLSSYTPVVGDWVLVEYAPSGPYVKGHLA